MCTPVNALVKPVATTVTATDMGDSESWENVTVADHAGDPEGTGNCESTEALQMMVLKTGLMFARNSPFGLLVV